jgi:hypothetical protein
MATLVTADQFEAKGHLMVVHLPTGSRFSTYAYEKPQDVQIAARFFAEEKLAEGGDFDLRAVEDMALLLLRELAAK